MKDTIKMPGGGYDIKVVRKNDIIACINENIVDKDIMLAFIEQLEVDATNFLSQGRWTSLPYIGTYRKNEYKERMSRDENLALVDAAKETLDANKYILFRKNLRDDIAKSIKRERIYKYILSQVVKKNRPFYEYLEKTKGETIARVICYTLYELTTIDNE